MAKRNPATLPLTKGQHVKVTIDAVIQESWEEFAGKHTYIIAFRAGRARLLEFPADAESITIEAVAG